MKTYQISPYNRQAAVEYAHQWALGRNPRYYDFENTGGDCTNFISQCIYAGSGIMNPTPTYGWYYYDLHHRSPSWTGVAYLHQFLTQNRGIGPYGEETSVDLLETGDVIQLQLVGRQEFHHSLLVVSRGNSPKSILVAAHTNDSDNRLLSSYSIQKMRGIHILGVRSRAE